MTEHKHHIVPKYRCKELGIDPDFDDNFVEVSREQHALIHWGYKCKDLKPLLEVCNPPQWVIDMIPLGDNRDVGAASVLALGEIEQIDVSGKNNPMWKGGISIGDNLEAYQKAYQQTPEYRAYDKKRQSTPEYKAYQKAHRQTPERKAYQKAYKQTPEYKAYQRAYYLRKKLEKQQGQGTLEQHIG
mgnify:FL=1